MELFKLNFTQVRLKDSDLCKHVRTCIYKSLTSVPKEKEASEASQNYCIVKVTNVDEKGALNRILRAFSVNKRQS